MIEVTKERAAMLRLIYSDKYAFIYIMRRHDSAEMRKALLVSNQHKLWYCRFICCRESIFRELGREWVASLVQSCGYHPEGLGRNILSVARWLGDAEDDPSNINLYTVTLHDGYAIKIIPSAGVPSSAEEADEHG